MLFLLHSSAKYCVIAASTAAGVLAYGAFPSQGNAQNLNVAAALDQEPLSNAYGILLGVHEADADSAPTLFLIQDNHADPTAQRNLSEILKELNRRFGVLWIFTESNAGDGSINHLKRAGTASIRREVAGNYLESGLLMGEEFLQLTSDEEYRIWGVEDLELYAKNFRFFSRAEELKNRLLAELGRFDALFEKYNRKLWTAELRRFVDQEINYDAGTLSLQDYLAYLKMQLPDNSTIFGRYPNLSRYFENAALAAKLDKQTAADQARLLISRLQNTSVDVDLGAVKSLMADLKAKKLSLTSFYAELHHLRREYSMPAAEFEQLAVFAAYVETQEGMQIAKLIDEIQSLEDEVWANLTQTDEQRMSRDLSQALMAFRKAVALKLPADSYRQYIAEVAGYSFNAMLQRLISEADPVDAALPDLDVLNEGLAIIRQFYQTTYKRDEIIVRNLTQKMTAENQHTAALVVGGFHTDSLIEKLNRSGLHVAVVTPLANPDAVDGSRYAEVLRYKFKDWEFSNGSP